MIKLFTHTDLDGIGCAVLAKLAYGDDVDITYCNYDDINAQVEDFVAKNSDVRMCYITDIRISDELAEKIDNSKYRSSVILLDHHQTALNLNKYFWCYVEVTDSKTGIKTSGTELFYQELCTMGWLQKSEVLDRFVETVRNYDTWRWAELGEDGVICKQVNDLLYLYGRDRFIRWCISEIHDCVFPRLYAADELLLQTKQKEIDEYVEEKNKKLCVLTMCGKQCGFVFADKYFSELGNRLCQMNPEIDFVSMIDIGSNTVSYRTIKDGIDLGKDVAQRFGGGGHAKAAGSSFSDEVLLKTIEEIFS